MTSDGARRLGYAATCLSCDGDIAADDRAHREHGVGAWHHDCDPPRSLSLYRRERDRARKQRKPRYYEIDDD